MAEKKALTHELPTAEKIVKVKMREGGFDPAHGKMREGGVYEFPLEQAARYVRLDLASPAPASAKTAREEDRAALQRDYRERQRVEAIDQEMSAAWDVEVRDLEGADLAVELAEEQVERAKEAADRAKRAAARAGKLPDSPEPGPVEGQGPR